MNVWLFTGADRLRALTRDQDGSNLPDDFGPWAMVRPVALDGDGADEKEAINLIGEHGYCCFD